MLARRNRVREFREARGWNRRELARQAGLRSEDPIRRMEMGERTRRDSRTKVANAFGERFEVVFPAEVIPRFSDVLPTYDLDKPYEQNFDGPSFTLDMPHERKINSRIEFCGFEVNSQLGVPAGLLLNANWIKLYADLGFDLLTYKTVRSQRRDSFPLPNCVLLETRGPLNPKSEFVFGSVDYEPKNIRDISITNSFGVPSSEPNAWQADIERAKNYLHKGQILIGSVVGTFKDSDSSEAIRDDFVLCAKLMKEAGPHIIELNFSCPNSPSEEGEIYLYPEMSSKISKSVKEEIGEVPLFIKVGYYEDPSLMEEVIRVNAQYIDGVVAINTIKLEVVKPNSRKPVFGNHRRKSGVCGAAIRQCGVETVKNLSNLKEKEGYDFVIVGVGGIMVPADIDEYLNIGIDAVESCTGAMFYPYLAYEYYLHSVYGIEK